MIDILMQIKDLVTWISIELLFVLVAVFVTGFTAGKILTELRKR